MTIAHFNQLPKDIQKLVNDSFWEYLRNTGKALTSPEQKREFVEKIEYRMDSGLSYFGCIEKYNPQA